MFKKILVTIFALMMLETAHSQPYTITYDGVTYENVGVQLVESLTYEQFYSIASVQPWFLGSGSCADSNTCITLDAKFSQMPGFLTGGAITRAVLPAQYQSDQFSLLEVKVAGVANIGNFFYSDIDAVNGFFYLLFSGPSAADTLASMQPNASAMKNAFNSQYAALAYGLNHDCTVYDSNGVCVSVFGRNTSLNDSSYDNNAAGLVLGYKPHAQFRIGTYIDQTLNNNTTGGVKVERSNPDVGVFGVWNMNTDGSGFELRLAANYGKRDLNVTRTEVGTSEAGSGRSDLNAYGALIETSFNQALSDSWMVKPYAGVRYLSIKRDSYS